MIDNIQFAPLHIPLERRLQTLAVLLYCLMVILGGTAVILFTIYVIFYTEYFRWIYIAYLTWIYTFDRNSCDRGARPVQWVKNWTWWVYFANFFPVKLAKVPTANFDPKRNYLLCCFPHGLLATGAFTAIVTNAVGVSKLFPKHKIHMCTLKTNFIIPILRELFLSLGVVSASVQSLNFLLSNPKGGNMTALVIGGAREASYTKPQNYKLVLKNRKGFVKVALRNGSDLVPVMSFGEPDILPQVEFQEQSLFKKFQLLVKKYFGFVPIVPAGRGIFQYKFGFLPRRREINVVVGEPIRIKKVQEPSQEEIDDMHSLFVEKLHELFESEKRKYLKNCEDIHIEII